jgi:16S rRNA (uracil1498-N3)-methyltransferase
MSKPTFFSADFISGQPEVELNAQETMHASKARRLGVGSEVKLLNGQGLAANAIIRSISKKSMLVGIENEIIVPASSKNLALAFALPKSDRQRILIEMLTQLGVDELIPLDCDRSITRYSDKIELKWQRYSIEACKQSQNPWLPKLGRVRSIESLLADAPAGLGVLYADIGGDACHHVSSISDDLVMIVGPEGGFSDREFEMLGSSTARAVKLAPDILRTETAAVVAAAQIIAASD